MSLLTGFYSLSTLIYVFQKQQTLNITTEVISGSYILVFLPSVSEQCIKGKFKLGRSMQRQKSFAIFRCNGEELCILKFLKY